jgi:hypothetical protein
MCTIRRINSPCLTDLGMRVRADRELYEKVLCPCTRTYVHVWVYFSYEAYKKNIRRGNKTCLTNKRVVFQMVFRVQG